MSKVQKLTIHIDRPEHGWTSVDLSVGDQRYSFYPSHVPHDSITDLVNALRSLLDGYDRVTVRWNDEPVEHEFVFEQKEGTVSLFVSIFLYDRAVAGVVPEQVLRFSGSVKDVVWPFWKALRDMQSRQSREEYEKHWRTFPEREMTELTKRVKELKRDVNRRVES